ncbi:hypothetical protein SLA2020_020600 [Shorea laevis]
MDGGGGCDIGGLREEAWGRKLERKNTGLARCGKSCRLRWANHLRPNLKKAAFSPEEERIIVELHAKLGNKWARMATQVRHCHPSKLIVLRKFSDSDSPFHLCFHFLCIFFGI